MMDMLHKFTDSKVNGALSIYLHEEKGVKQKSFNLRTRHHIPKQQRLDITARSKNICNSMYHLDLGATMDKSSF